MNQKCKKKTFLTAKEADIRAGQINHENSKKDGFSLRLRPYKCNECGNYHLTKMSKHKHKMVTDPNYKTRVNEIKFIETETEYWNQKFS